MPEVQRSLRQLEAPRGRQGTSKNLWSLGGPQAGHRWDTGSCPSVPSWAAFLTQPRGQHLARLRRTAGPLRSEGFWPRSTQRAGQGTKATPCPPQSGLGSWSLSFPICNMGRQRVKHPHHGKDQNWGGGHVTLGEGAGDLWPHGAPLPPGRWTLRGPASRPRPPTRRETGAVTQPTAPVFSLPGAESPQCPGSAAPPPFQGIRSRSQNKGGWQPVTGSAQPGCPLSPIS